MLSHIRTWPREQSTSQLSTSQSSCLDTLFLTIVCQEEQWWRRQKQADVLAALAAAALSRRPRWKLVLAWILTIKYYPDKKEVCSHNARKSNGVANVWSPNPFHSQISCLAPNCLLACLLAQLARWLAQSECRWEQYRPIHLVEMAISSSGYRAIYLYNPRSPR